MVKLVCVILRQSGVTGGTNGAHCGDLGRGGVPVGSGVSRVQLAGDVPESLGSRNSIIFATSLSSSLSGFVDKSRLILACPLY